MNINGITYKPTAKQTTFKTYDRTVYNAVTHQYKYNTTTRFARNDLDWEKFIDFIFNKYKNTERVNTVVHACSDGEEAITLALSVKSRGEAAKKFLPVTAKDIDKINIEHANKGIYEINFHDELRCMKNLTKQRFWDYFDSVSGERCIKPNCLKIKAKENLKSLINYSEGDVLKDFKKIPEENTVLLLRNVWPYLGTKRATILAGDLAYRLKPSSTLVIGIYDRAWNFCKILEKAGFKETYIPYVYETAG